MGRKRSSKTQQTSKSKFTKELLVVADLINSSSVDDCHFFFFFCRKDHEKAEFEVHEVYAVDVLISTGEGKVRGNPV